MQWGDNVHLHVGTELVFLPLVAHFFAFKIICKYGPNIQPAPSMTLLVYSDPSKTVYSDPSKMVYSDPF